MMLSDKREILSERDYFVERIMKKYVYNFSFDDLIIGNHGKPELREKDFSFNLSHSGNHYALLISDQQYCGIDIQEVKNKDKYIDALKSVFTDNEFSNLNSKGTNEEFFQFWSLKEAIIKAIGSSLWFGRDYDFTEIMNDYINKWVFSNNLNIYSTLINPDFCITIALPEKPKVFKILNF